MYMTIRYAVLLHIFFEKTKKDPPADRSHGRTGDLKTFSVSVISCVDLEIALGMILAMHPLSTTKKSTPEGGLKRSHL